MTTDQYGNEIMEAVALAESQPETTKDTINLSTGVVLKRKWCSPLRLQQIVSQFKLPEIPKIYDEENKRWLPNPDSPDYIALKEQVEADQNMAAIDAMIAFGTELEYVPEDIEHLDSEGWVEDNAMFGLTFNSKSKKARYLSWVKSIAIATAHDLEEISRVYQSAYGISAEGVSDKVKSFQSEPERDTN